MTDDIERDEQQGILQERVRDLIAEAFPKTRLDDYVTADQYYDGRHPTQLTDRAKQYLEASGYPYAENFCATVVDALTERTIVVGLAGDEDSPLGEWLWDVWDRNDGDALSEVLLNETAKKGDGYLIVEWDGEKQVPTWTFNGPDIVGPVYRNNALFCVLKQWDEKIADGEGKEKTVKRLNIYWPDRIERFLRTSKDEKGDWVAYTEEGQTGGWPQPWTYQNQPIGIPIIHFANRPGARKFGRAEHRNTIPQQDRLNKELLDLSYVLDAMGWPQRWAAGVDPQAKLESVPGEVWSSPSPESKYGQFEAANPDGLLRAIEATLVRIAARSRTPVHLFSGTTIPSGEALKTAEAGLVAKARQRHVSWGSTWVDALRTTCRVAVAFGTGGKGAPPVEWDAIDEATINILWADPESRNEKEHYEALAKMRELGVSKRTVLAMIPGIDPDEEIRQSEQEAQDAAEQQAATFDAGGLLGGPVGGPRQRPNLATLGADAE